MASLSAKLLIIASHLLVPSAASLRGRRLGVFADSFAAVSQAVEDVPDASDRMETRIIGGNTAPKGRYSYAVSLQDGIGHFCGGTLIAADVVLTAAHCQGGSYDVVIGRHERDSNDGEIISMDYEIPHPKYNDKTTDNDFNLVFLSRPTKQKVSLVNINDSSNSPKIGEEVYVMGWGDTAADDYTQKLADKLQDVSVNVISNSDCDDSEGQIGGWYDSYKNQISDNMLCARDNGEDACQGDSGGPLVIKGKDGSGADDIQVGLVSWGIGCANKNFPGVYARISEAYDWIKDEVCSKSKEPPANLCGGGGSGSSPKPPSSNPKPPKPSPPSPSPPSSGGSSNGKWRTVLYENFDQGYGTFTRGGRHAKLYKSAKFRDGVIGIQNGKGRKSSFYSENIEVDGYSNFKVTFSFMGVSMEDDDSFCLDYSTNSGKKWKEVECWSPGDDNGFENKIWQDDVSVEFSEKKANEINIRFRCEGNSNKDDVLFDRIEVEAK
jgi:trypsin